MRIVIATISLVLLIACVVTLVAWVRSYWVIDEWSMANDDGQVFAVLSYQGAVHHTRAGGNSAPRRWSYDSHDVPDGATWAHLYTTPGYLAWQRFGFVRVQRAKPLVAGQVMPFGTPPGATNTAVAWAGQAGFGSRQSVTPWLIMAPYDAWVVPYWALAVVTGVVPAMWVLWFVRRVVRRRRGLCVRCGYDLRASTDRCPECGTIVKKKTLSGAVPVTTTSTPERST